MPIPSPKDGESKKEFMDRCMADEVMVEEYPDKDQRYAVCNSAWDDRAGEELTARIESIKNQCRSELGYDSPVLRSMFPEEARIAVEDDDGGPKLTGYGIVYNRKSQPIMDMFEEIIRPGAARKVLESNPDIRCLHNHDPNYVYGRTTSGTMTLEENQRGVKYSAIPPDTQWAKDNLVSIKRGDITGSSFSFRVARDGEKWTEQASGLMLREIFELSAIGDLGPVTYPAYRATTAEIRSVIVSAGLDFESLSALFVRAQRGQPLTDADRDLISASIETLKRFIPEPVPPAEPDAQPPTQVELLRRELELLSLS